MNRRQFSTYLAASALASPAVRAQQPGRTYRITFVSSLSERNPATEVTLAGLQSMGFIEGRNLAVDRVGFGLDEDRLVDAVKKAIAAGTDLLMGGGGSNIKAAKAATSTIPIVGFSDDMVREGHVASLARPTGNVTGVSILGTELDGKRQELLIEALPKSRRIAALADLRPQVPAHYESLRAAVRSSPVELSLLRAGNAQEIEAALKQAKEQGDEAVNVLASSVMNGHRQVLFATAKTLHLPIMYQWPESTTEGALLAYGPGYADSYRLQGLMAGKILRGAKPSELPIEQPTAFKLAVNLKTARELGITLPSRLVERADEVVE